MHRRSFLTATAGISAASVLAFPQGVSAAADEELELLQTYVAGSARSGVAYAVRLAKGDPVELKRVPQDRFDRRAIEVWKDGVRLGKLPGIDCRTLAALMDAGMPLMGRVAAVSDGAARPIAVVVSAHRRNVAWAEA